MKRCYLLPMELPISMLHGLVGPYIMARVELDPVIRTA